MWLTWSWAFWALATTIKASCENGGSSYASPPDSTASCLDESVELSDTQDLGLSCSGVEIVFYGETNNYCQPPVPYTVQVPKSTVPLSQVPGGKIYDYLIEAPKSNLMNVGFVLPVKVEAPVAESGIQDFLIGKTYEINVQSPPNVVYPKKYKYDFGVQKTLPIQRKSYIDYSIDVQPTNVASNAFLASLPYALQVPANRQEASSMQLTGLTTKVDKILVPVHDSTCESYCNGATTDNAPQNVNDASCL